MSKYFISSRKTFFVVFLISLSLFCFGRNTYAEEEEDEDELGPKITIENITSGSNASLWLDLTLSEVYNGDYFEIYRGTENPAQGGVLKLIDTLKIYGSWTQDFGAEYHYRYSTNREFVIYADDAWMGDKITMADEALSIGQTYYYQIVLKDDDSESIAVSNINSGQIQLSPPSILSCYSSSGKSVKITWRGADQADGYIIYRATGNKWTRIKTVKIVGIQSLNYTDRKVKSGKTYKYRIQAYKNVGERKVYSDYCSVFKVKLKKPSVQGKYKKGSIYGSTLSTAKLTEVRRVVQSFKDNLVKKNSSDYVKILAIVEYLIGNCNYEEKADTAWDALVNRKAGSAGMSRAIAALCDAVGLKYRCVKGNSGNYFNMIKVSGKWYIVDMTTGIFLAGSDFCKLSGMTWNTKGLPKCSIDDHPDGLLFNGLERYPLWSIIPF